MAGTLLHQIYPSDRSMQVSELGKAGLSTTYLLT